MNNVYKALLTYLKNGIEIGKAGFWDSDVITRHPKDTYQISMGDDCV